MFKQQNRVKRDSHALQFNVAQLLKETTGASRSYEVEAEALGELDEGVTIVSPITGHLKFLRTGPNILVTGMLAADIEKNCGRCLTTFTMPVSIDLEEEFYPTIDIVTGTPLPPSADVEEANLIDEQHILDLQEVVRQEFLLISDTVLYCRPDCKGLCPKCGQDRNINPCDCQDEVIDERWAGLQKFEIED